MYIEYLHNCIKRNKEILRNANQMDLDAGKISNYQISHSNNIDNDSDDSDNGSESQSDSDEEDSGNVF